MLYITDAYKLVSTYSLILLIITVLAIGFAILYVLYLKPKMQFESSEIEVIEPITRKKSWIGIAAYFGCFYIIAIIIQTIIVTVYLLSTGQTELVEESSDYLTILNLCNFATNMVRLVMLVALLVANLVDAPGISWINYTTLIYDIFSAAIARFAGLTKRSQKDSAN